ncbi:hypothetical protein [Opacimonas viscosa]|uniref:Uncharacterized protein n=1 Tax=Opacimonas viscosa TaxID=2961944 RepID=A0AA41X0A6_9ALTE|nr:hypothetical protein [Opacimonas viscosa]MCP3429560.1 hypothetical protein [Opacimonas viscosa]
MKELNEMQLNNVSGGFGNCPTDTPVNDDLSDFFQSQSDAYYDEQQRIANERHHQNNN